MLEVDDINGAECVRFVRFVRFVRSGRLRRWVQAGRPGAQEVRRVDALGDK